MSKLKGLEHVTVLLELVVHCMCWTATPSKGHAHMSCFPMQDKNKKHGLARNLRMAESRNKGLTCHIFISEILLREVAYAEETRADSASPCVPCLSFSTPSFNNKLM